MSFGDVRRKGAEILSKMAKISKDEKTIKACVEGACMLNETNYEGGDNLLLQVQDIYLEVADDPEFGVVNGLHDPICDHLYDNNCNMEKWSELWNASTEGMEDE